MFLLLTFAKIFPNFEHNGRSLKEIYDGPVICFVSADITSRWNWRECSSVCCDNLQLCLMNTTWSAWPFSSKTTWLPRSWAEMSGQLFLCSTYSQQKSWSCNCSEACFYKVLTPWVNSYPSKRWPLCCPTSCLCITEFYILCAFFVAEMTI